MAMQLWTASRPDSGDDASSTVLQNVWVRPWCTQVARIVAVGVAALAVVGLVANFTGHTSSLSKVNLTSMAHRVELDESDPSCFFISKGQGMACKLSPMDHSMDGAGTATVKHPFGPQRECERLCRDQKNCTGYEYRTVEMRCELWHAKIGYAMVTDHPYEFECKVKICGR
mmetsp:Transcript_49434/g.95570  ORF Transcript_49434/g.95570 Transcript_49434/m.95570 type:complete len:171 (+) Transcript_49434:33-545(+)